MRRSLLSLALLIAACCGCSSSKPESAYNSPPPVQATGHPVLSALPDPADLTIYEGCPHQSEEAELLAKEIKEKKTFELHGFHFYEEPLEVRAEDRQKLVEVLKTDGTFLGIQRGKLCGGFHPDYAVVWKVDGVEYAILLCFGCYDANVYKADQEFKYEINGHPGTSSLELLMRYHKHLPK